MVGCRLTARRQDQAAALPLQQLNAQGVLKFADELLYRRRANIEFLCSNAIVQMPGDGFEGAKGIE